MTHIHLGNVCWKNRGTTFNIFQTLGVVLSSNETEFADERKIYPSTYVCQIAQWSHTHSLTREEWNVTGFKKRHLLSYRKSVSYGVFV